MTPQKPLPTDPVASADTSGMADLPYDDGPDMIAIHGGKVFADPDGFGMWEIVYWMWGDTPLR